jgi:beta-glucosidase
LPKKVRNIAKKVWFGITIPLFLILATATMVTSLSTDIFNMANLVMPGGGVRAVYADGVDPIYISDYSSKAQVYAAAQQFNIDMCEEGFVLLKNKNNALPMMTPESMATNKPAERPKISVFGKNSVNLAYGGSGSGAADDSDLIELYQALELAGYEYNPTLKDFYDSSTLSGDKREGNTKDLDSGDTVILSTAETPQSLYTDEVKDSYDEYNDLAIIVITRVGGEGMDLPRLMRGATGYRNEDDHFLQLDQNEEDLIVSVTNSNFDKVIIVINSGSAIELGFLKETSPYVTEKGYLIDPSKIDAAIWMGFPGQNGTIALGRILNGNVNPSGRTVDTYATDFKDDPTWVNFGDNLTAANNKTGIIGGDQYVFEDNPDVPYYFVEYEEGIYVGYRYYETRGHTDGESWYNNAVVYPFGYGMSYTTFSWEITDKTEIENKTITDITKSNVYTIKVKVTNTGSVAGKEVVQLYGNAPYISGGIEKSHVVLVAFAKTDLIEPGMSDTVELTFDPYYLASYDDIDANHNAFKGYELDGGNYNLFVSRNAHEKVATIPFSVVAGGIKYSKSTVDDSITVENRYTDQTDVYFNSALQLDDVTVSGETRKGMSRTDWEGTKPTTPIVGELRETALLDSLKDTSHNNPTDFSSIEMPWTDEDNGLVLRDMLYDGVTGEKLNEQLDGTFTADYDDPRWELLLNQASIAEMVNLYNYAAYRTDKIESMGLPRTDSADGPVGWVLFLDKDRFYDTVSYCSQSVVGSTWNSEKVYEFGQMVGNEGIAGNEHGDKMPYTGWYAPGANLHRSMFGGRNFEYYSEDSFLSGKLAASQIQGARSRGIITYIKHFAVNDQETHRSISGNSSWLTEQSLREIYLRPFEIAVKEGQSLGVMSSFNRIGTRWTGGDYRLLTEILRNEWGFRGTVICDFNTVPAYMNSRQMAYAGGDLNLSVQPKEWVNASRASDVYVLRQNTKNTSYAVVNSNAMNGDIIGERMPLWQLALITVDIVVFAGLGVWGFFVFKKKK